MAEKKEKKQVKEQKNKGNTPNLASEVKELKELLQRKQAELENYCKQTEKRIAEIQQMSAKNIILQILPILDNFELALKNTKESTDFTKGIELIYAQLKYLLESNEVKEIKAEGQFDPYFHEALMKVESEQPENTILEVLQKGYTLHDNVIRHSKVKISAGKKEESK